MKKHSKLRVLLPLFCAAVLAAVIGFAVSAENDGYVATVGSTNYTDLTEALTAGSSGTKVTLLADANLPSAFPVTGTLKVDLAGHKIVAASDAFGMKTGSTLYLWSSAEGGGVTASNALINLTEDIGSAPSKVYLGAFAGSTTATAAFRDNMTVKARSVVLTNQSESVASTVTIDGGTYIKTSSPSTSKTGGYGMFHASKHQLSVTAKNATFRFDTSTGSLLAYTQANRGAVTADFTSCTITAPKNGLVCATSSFTDNALAVSVSFATTEIDGMKLSTIASPSTILIKKGCKINSDIDLTKITTTGTTVTAADGTNYTLKLETGGAFVSSANGYDYNYAATGRSSAPKVTFKSSTGEDREVAYWFLGEIPEFRGTPETKVVDGLTCTYGYPDATSLAAVASVTYTPTLVGFGTPFLGKLSIDSNLLFTAYVPVKAGEAGDLALNGETLVLPKTVYVNGDLYYPFDIAVTPSEALLPLTFTYTIGGENFKTQVSLLKYLEKILALDSTDTAQKRLAFAILSYVSETVAKFNPSDTYSRGMQTALKAAMRIYSAYALSYRVNLPAAGQVAPTENIKGAAFDLGAEAALVVYLSRSYVGDLVVSYTDQGGKSRTVTVPSSSYAEKQIDGTTYFAARVYLPVADYLRDLTLTATGGSITYSLPIYMADIAAENDGELPPYTLAFYYYTKAAFLYRQTEIMSLTAMEEARITMGPKANSNPAGTSQFNPASALLTLALQVHHTGEADAYCDRLVELLGLYVDGAGNEPCADLGPFWTPAQICLGMGIARQTPVVWDRIDDATKEKLDFFMSVFACIQSFGTDDNNNYTTGPSGNGNYNKSWNPNYRMGNVFPMIGVTLYFGSADAVNEILTSFDYDTYIAKMQEYGFTTMLASWTGTGDKARAAMNNSSTKTTAYLKNGSASGTGYGVLRKGYTYHYLGHGLDDLAGIFTEVMSFTYSEIVTSDSSKMSGGVYTQAEYDSKGGVDHGYTIVVGAPKAFINDGTKSPVEGKYGMISEFNGGDAGGIRSSAAYCDHDFIMAVGAMAAMVEMGLWSPEADRSLYEAVWVGNTDLIYKLEHGYHSYSKGQYDSVDHEQSYGGYYMMKSLWCDWLAGYHAE